MTQTFVYAIYCPNKNEVKIGYATDPLKRLASLQTGTTDRLDIITTFSGGLEKEKQLHDTLKNYRVSGEWFTYNSKVREAIAKAFIESYPKSDKEDVLYSYLDSLCEEILADSKTKKRTRIYFKSLKNACERLPNVTTTMINQTMKDLGFERTTDASRVVFFQKSV
jgi:hypothetical protein